MITIIDYAVKSVARLIQQYRDKAKFKALIELYASIAQEIENAAFDLLLLRDVETAFGVQLDVLGRIVGQSRTLADVTGFVFFGYLDGVIPDSTTGSFGDLDDPAAGERYRSEEETGAGSLELEDPEYRLFIKARILKNHTIGTLNQVIAAVKLLSETDQFTITEGIMELDLNFTPGSLSATTLDLLQSFDLLPRPGGVAINITSVP